MSRFKPDPVVRADDFDPDESAVLCGSYGYLQVQRIALAVSTWSRTNADESEASIAANGAAMAGIVLEVYRDVILRQRTIPYQEGVDRPKVPFTAEALLAEPIETLMWLVETGMTHVAPMITPKHQGTPDNPDPIVPLTPAAQEAGMTTARFPADDANQGALPIQ